MMFFRLDDEKKTFVNENKPPYLFELHFMDWVNVSSIM